jgi:hypothetical protein
MPLLKTKALPVSDVPNCESWVNIVEAVDPFSNDCALRRRYQQELR